MSKTFTIGTEGNQPFPIKNDGVSREHARITIEDNVWKIEDLDSTNGTFIMNEDGEFERIVSKIITPHTIIRLGSGGHLSVTFWASRMTAENQNEFAYEFNHIIKKSQEFDEKIEKETSKIKNLRFVPIIISLVIMVITLLPIIPSSSQMTIMRIGMLLGPIFSAFFIKNDAVLKLMGMKKKIIVCPKCGRPMSDFDLNQQKCSACKAHS